MLITNAFDENLQEKREADDKSDDKNEGRGESLDSDA